MKTVGIIAEYNPFHTGHQYHIEQSKKLSGADNVMVVMSGNFVQRGTASIADKYTRAQSAILGGADLVVELPTVYATGSAEIFSMGAVSLLNKTGIVDTLCFGTETADLDALNRISEVLYNEPQEFKDILQSHLKNGINLPTARAAALKAVLEEPKLTSIINAPNNILALEYLKALNHFNSPIKAVNIIRKGASYHDISFSEDYTSATALRECFNNEDFDKIADFMPKSVFELYKNNYGTKLPVETDDISELMYHTLLINRDNLTDFMDVSSSLAAKITNYLASGKILSFSELILHLKSKEITYTRISRALLNIFLGITNEDLILIKKANYPAYLRVLAFNEKGKMLLNDIKKTSELTIITNLSDNIGKLNNVERRIIDIDIFASNIYRNLVKTKFNQTLTDDFRTRPYIFTSEHKKN